MGLVDIIRKAQHYGESLIEAEMLCLEFDLKACLGEYGLLYTMQDRYGRISYYPEGGREANTTELGLFVDPLNLSADIYALDSVENSSWYRRYMLIDMSAIAVVVPHLRLPSADMRGHDEIYHEFEVGVHKERFIFIRPEEVKLQRTRVPTCLVRLPK